MVEKPYGLLLVEAGEILASDYPHNAFPLLYEAWTNAPIHERRKIVLRIEELEKSSSVWQLVSEAARVSQLGFEKFRSRYAGNKRVHHLLNAAMRISQHPGDRDLVRKARIKHLKDIAAAWKNRGRIDLARLAYHEALDEAARLFVQDRLLCESIELCFLKLCGDSLSGGDAKLHRAAVTLGLRHAYFGAVIAAVPELFKIYGRRRTISYEVPLLYQELKAAYSTIAEGPVAQEFADYVELFADLSQTMEEYELALNAYDCAIGYATPRIPRQPKEQLRVMILLLRSARSALKLRLNKDAWFRLAQVRMMLEDSIDLAPARVRSCTEIMLRAENLIRAGDKRSARTAGRLICVVSQCLLQCGQVTMVSSWMTGFHTGNRWHSDHHHSVPDEPQNGTGKVN